MQRHIITTLAAIFIASNPYSPTGSIARADEIYWCDGPMPQVVVASGVREAQSARAQPCVRAWHAKRQEEARQDARRRQIAVSDPRARGVTSREFCVRGEACHLNLPRWSPRWDYVPAREIRVRFLYN